MLAANAQRSVLLETAKPTGGHDRSFLFLDPVAELTAWNESDLEELLKQIDSHLAAGAYVAGYFHYECGEAFVGLTGGHLKREDRAEPLAWLGVFPHVKEFRHSEGEIQDNRPTRQAGDAAIFSDGLQISRVDYSDRIQRVQEYLEGGHSYQVNFTDSIRGSIRSSPLAVYETLLRRQPVSYAAYIQGQGETFLSFSPELFYRTSGGSIKARPMKGTWPRGLDQEEDCQAAKQLKQDEKNRSEHVTIVDLLRNDLGRICTAGSVKVESLFFVEHYSTLLQMTSTLSGSLQTGLPPSRIFRSLFPSGSITGAPKRRTMEIIRELESGTRGIYTGAIGYFAPAGEACFNVAIRTMALRGQSFTLGVGGGITADSDANEEYDECRLKGAFLTGKRPPFSLVETMRCSEARIPLLDLHMARLARSAAYFGICYDERELIAELSEAASQSKAGTSKLRVELRQDGEWAAVLSPLETAPWSGRLLLASERTDSRDVFLRHKTTNRKLYDDSLGMARAAAYDEVLFRNEKDALTECAISNIFLFTQGRWLTPSLHCGVLAGVQRQLTLGSLHALQAEIRMEDLREAESFIVCNALRGTRRLYEVMDASGELIWQDPSLAGRSLTEALVAQARQGFDSELQDRQSRAPNSDKARSA